MQTINRNNYEEFFLLYIDGELNAAEQRAVENFILQNADLAVEFDMLLNTKLSAETIEFTDKENLLRTEGNNINEANYEEYFLLYIDNELSAVKREEVEMYVLQHPKLQDEFITLKNAVLAPEIISYGDKKELYRTEKRRTVYLRPWRFAAAAIFVCVCAVGFWLMQKQNNVHQLPVAINKSVKIQPEQIKPKQINATVKPVDTMQQVQQPQITAAQSSPKKEEKKKAIETAIIKQKKENTVDNALHGNDNKETQQVAVQQPVITHKNVALQKQPPVITPDIADVPEHINPKENNDVSALQATSPNNKNKVYNVAYKEINTNDNNNSLHVGMLDLNKTKVKNLFKKAGRVFGNKSNDLANNNGKLQVANFEIETKKQ